MALAGDVGVMGPGDRSLPQVSGSGEPCGVFSWAGQLRIPGQFLLPPSLNVCRTPSLCPRTSRQCVYAQSLSPTQLLETPCTVARQAPLSIGFPKQEYWNGLPFPPPGNSPHPETEPESPLSLALAGRFFTTALPGKSQDSRRPGTCLPNSQPPGFLLRIQFKASSASSRPWVGMGLPSRPLIPAHPLTSSGTVHRLFLAWSPRPLSRCRHLLGAFPPPTSSSQGGLPQALSFISVRVAALCSHVLSRTHWTPPWHQDLSVCPAHSVLRPWPVPGLEENIPPDPPRGTHVRWGAVEGGVGEGKAGRRPLTTCRKGSRGPRAGLSRSLSLVLPPFHQPFSLWPKHLSVFFLN